MIGRFISPDTTIPDPASPQSFNRYTYCLNNPLKYIDPSGHNAIDDMLAAQAIANGDDPQAVLDSIYREIKLPITIRVMPAIDGQPGIDFIGSWVDEIEMISINIDTFVGDEVMFVCTTLDGRTLLSLQGRGSDIYINSDDWKYMQYSGWTLEDMAEVMVQFDSMGDLRVSDLGIEIPFYKDPYLTEVELDNGQVNRYTDLFEEDLGEKKLHDTYWQFTTTSGNSATFYGTYGWPIGPGDFFN